MKRNTVRLFITTIILTLIIVINSFAAAVPKKVLDTNNSVVRIFTSYDDDTYATGSGFVIADEKDGTYIVTNHHVAVEDDPTYISVILNSDTDINANVVASDASRDLAVIKVSYPLGLKALRLNNTTANKGDGIYVIGYPGGADTLAGSAALNREDSTITEGIVSAIRTIQITNTGSDVELLQISAAINHGNSGGPVLDENGTVIGISTFTVGDAQGIHGAISATELIDFLEKNSIPYTSVKGKGGIPVLPIIAGAFVLVLAGIVVILRRGKKHTSDESAVVSDENLELNPIERKQPKPKRVRRRNYKPVIALLCAIALVGGGIGVHQVCQQALKNIGTPQYSQMDESAVKFLSMFDKQLSAYVDAYKLLNDGEYEQAEKAFIELNGYKDSAELALEARYRLGNKYLEDGDFSKATAIFKELSNGDVYKDSDVKILDVLYAQAYKHIEAGSYGAALRILDELSSKGYNITIDDINAVKDLIYVDAIEDYREGNVIEAKSKFDDIPDYEDANKYIALCKIVNKGNVDFIKQEEIWNDIETCLNMIDFEDASDVILNKRYARIFLNGMWETIDGEYYFKMDYTNNSTSHNFPKVGDRDIYVSYSIQMGDYIVRKRVDLNNWKEDDNGVIELSMQVIDKNTISVYCHANSQTYTLYRQ